MWLTYACFISFDYTYDSFLFLECLISITRISFDHILCFHILDFYLSRFAWTYVVFSFVFLLLLVFICLYLFTGLFKLSRVSFPAAGFRRKLGYGWRVQIGALVRTLHSWFLSGFWRRLLISHLYPILILYFFSIEPFVTFYNLCIHLYYIS